MLFGAGPSPPVIVAPGDASAPGAAVAGSAMMKPPLRGNAAPRPGRTSSAARVALEEADEQRLARPPPRRRAGTPRPRQGWASGSKSAPRVVKSPPRPLPLMASVARRCPLEAVSPRASENAGVAVDNCADGLAVRPERHAFR